MKISWVMQGEACDLSVLSKGFDKIAEKMREVNLFLLKNCLKSQLGQRSCNFMTQKRYIASAKNSILDYDVLSPDEDNLMSTNGEKQSKDAPFTEGQIRAKAYEIWESQRERSPEDNWIKAIEALEEEQKVHHVVRGVRKFIAWTGIREKKGWDLLQLLVVPVLLAFVTFQLQDFAKARDRQLAEDTTKRERAAAIDKAQQDILVRYFDQMTEAVKTDKLLEKPYIKESFLIAQIRTVTALQSLNPERQRSVIQFLRTADLYNPCFGRDQCESFGILFIAKLNNLVLQKADLVGIDLRRTDMRGACLRESNLLYANFESANLNDVNFKNASLRLANLSNASLKDANLEGANLERVDLRGVSGLTLQQLQLAKNWQTAIYDPSVRQQLGLPPEPQTP